MLTSKWHTADHPTLQPLDVLAMCEVGQVGLPAVQPVADVMKVAVVRRLIAPGVHTAAVTDRRRPALAGIGEALGAAQLERLGRTVDHQGPDGGVTGQVLEHLAADRGAVLIGRLLKQRICEEAGRRGAVVVVSRVDRRNDRMLRVNRHLGAVTEPDPDHPEDILCFIPI